MARRLRLARTRTFRAWHSAGFYTSQFTASDFLSRNYSPVEREGMTTHPLPNTATGTQLPSTVQKPASMSMNPSDFINMMITQLQNQDPMQPTDSNALLQQMSAIGQMQASSDMQTTLQSLTLQNQIGAASSLIGKSVTGQDANGNVLVGLVNSVQVTQSGVTLQLDSGKSLDLSKLTAIAPAPASATTGTTH